MEVEEEEVVETEYSHFLSSCLAGADISVGLLRYMLYDNINRLAC